MKQVVKKVEKTEIKAMISKNFIGAMEKMSSDAIGKNSQFSDSVKKDRSNFSKIKKGDGRYVTIDMVYEAVNILGLNANFIFVEDGETKEEILREGVVNNSNVSGNNNTVLNGKNNNVVQGDNNGRIYNAEKIVQGMPAKERKEMNKYMDNVAKEILDLKKTIAHYKKELREKDKKLMATQEELIKQLKNQQNENK